MTPSDIQNLENGTPVFVLRQNEDGSWGKRSGIIFNDMIVREHTAFSRLGFENNYKSLGVYDPNAFSEENDSLIGKVALFNDGSAEYKVES